MFARGELPVLWPLRLLRAVGRVSSTVLFIPLFHTLLSAWTCDMPLTGTPWQSAGFVCFRSGHLAIAVVATVLAAVLLAQCLVFALLFYDPHPLTAS
jgi:hypothetical protein